ncbi:hypothetical protein [Streptomyces globosus]|uniref:hypothetical protein n=1 Tax=Streptomyces globosus TaxID=68209 RepID=UPI0031D8ED30
MGGGPGDILDLVAGVLRDDAAQVFLAHGLVVRGRRDLGQGFQGLADAAAGPAADHLATAWQAAYGRSPDPVPAYSESIKAVEAAAHAVVQPNNSKAPLGTMLGEIKNARHKFAAAIPSPGGDPIAPAEAMMRALWEGQTSRHGGQTPTAPETLEAAQAGVHLAATLVQWFVSGPWSAPPDPERGGHSPGRPEDCRFRPAAGPRGGLDIRAATGAGLARESSPAGADAGPRRPLLLKVDPGGG